MRRVLRDNGLSLTLFALFLVFLIAQSVAGYKANNSDNQQHHQPSESLGQYVTSGAFVEATFENWESEFLQMGAYVLLTALLIQKGSPESKNPDSDPVDEDPSSRTDAPDAPGPVRRGGLALTVYEHSLSIALFALFLVSFVLHALGGHAEFNQQQAEHGASAVSLWSFVTSSQFWFQSMQNWQSEFLAVAALTVLGIVLRQRGSPESKPVAAPHAQTGSG
jgi:uncharacterized protein DUF6766